MDAFRLAGYIWSEPRDQEPEDTYYTSDDEVDNSDDYDDPEWAFEEQHSLEAQCRVQ